MQEAVVGTIVGFREDSAHGLILLTSVPLREERSANSSFPTMAPAIGESALRFAMDEDEGSLWFTTMLVEGRSRRDNLLELRFFRGVEEIYRYVHPDPMKLHEANRGSWERRA
jgi:hypothetical protein